MMSVGLLGIYYSHLLCHYGKYFTGVLRSGVSGGWLVGWVVVVVVVVVLVVVVLVVVCCILYK